MLLPHLSLSSPPHQTTTTNNQEVISLGAVAASSSFMTAKEIAAFLADEIRAITGVQNVLVTAQLTALGLDSLGFVEVRERRSV